MVATIQDARRYGTLRPDTVDDLGLRGCLYLWALLTAQQRRLPVAPVKRQTVQVISLLEEMRVIQIPWQQTSRLTDAAAMITPIEGIQWRMTWTVYEPNLLIQALDDYFDCLCRDEFTINLLLRMWVELSVGETERYFEHQLLKHRFPIEWSQDIAYATNDLDAVLSMAQWRYCVWAAIRRGASLAIQNSSQSEGIREAIYQELKRRAATVSTGAWAGASFLPFNSTPESALGRGFSHQLANLGSRYWTASPIAEELAKTRSR